MHRMVAARRQPSQEHSPRRMFFHTKKESPDDLLSGLFVFYKEKPAPKSNGLSKGDSSSLIRPRAVVLEHHQTVADGAADAIAHQRYAGSGHHHDAEEIGERCESGGEECDG